MGESLELILKCRLECLWEQIQGQGRQNQQSWVQLMAQPLSLAVGIHLTLWEPQFPHL